MPERLVRRGVFLVWLFFYDVIDCLPPSTSQREPNMLSEEEDQQSSAVTTGAASPPHDNGAHPPWIGDALADISHYLRAHKFNEYDRRYELRADLARRRYYAEFPRPPLRSLHWEVNKNCEQSFLECVDYLRRRIRSVALKRTDDTVVVIQEQQWDLHKNAKQIAAVDGECRKMLQVDDVQASSFEGPIERHQWRVTASYYMCWYTMKSEKLLEHLKSPCDNFANCLDPALGPHTGDPRSASGPFSCALYSFCPDPCCPLRHLTGLENCWDTPDNPCFRPNPKGQRECALNRSMNTDFSDLVLNRWNVTCHCPQKGYVWNSFFGICVDVNECTTGERTCNLDTQMCFNLPGTFKCVCKWGHDYDQSSKNCTKSATLARFLVGRVKEDSEKELSMWTRMLKTFAKSEAAELSSGLYLAVCPCIAFKYALQ